MGLDFAQRDSCNSSYTANGHELRFFEFPHPSPLPKGEGDKSRNPCPCRVYQLANRGSPDF